MAGVAFAVEGDGVGFATESYAASALYTTLASLSGALWRIRRASKTSKANPPPAAASALSMVAQNLINMVVVSAVSGTVLLGLLAAKHF
jgi:hypothetical protein